jgi:hypothetical protein
LKRYLNELGKPQIELAGLKLWVHSYQYRNADDYDDANWLNATAICAEKGATVVVEGAFIRTTEILAWQRAVQELAENLVGEARLECLEPEISVTLKGSPLGAVEMQVQITRDQLTQDYTFTFAVDQSYLGPLASQCTSLLSDFPVRGV